MYFLSDGMPSGRKAIVGCTFQLTMQTTTQKANQSIGKQLLRVMKLTVFILFAVCLQFNARANGRFLTIGTKKVSFDKLFSKIEKQAGSVFFIDAKGEGISKWITVEVKNVAVKEMLQVFLEGQALEYDIVDRSRFIKRKAAPPGRRLVFRGESFKGMEKASVINVMGEFGLMDDAMTIYGADGVTITIEKERSRRNDTGDINQVKGEDIEKQPVTNSILALEGRVAGIIVIQNEGYLSLINPIDIESIEVLKDTDAVAIYGNRRLSKAHLQKPEYEKPFRYVSTQ